MQLNLNLERAAEVHKKVEPVLAVVAFVAGFTWDAATLVRIDRWLDNVLLGAYLLVLGIALVIEQRVETSPEDWPRLSKHTRWLTLAIQFLFGGLFSAYVVYYLRSASWGPTLVFVLILALVFVLNEFLHRVLKRAWLRIALFWFVAFSYLLFLVPVLTGWFGNAMFFVAALGASALSALVARIMFQQSWRALPDLRRTLMFVGLTTGMGVLQVGGCIPPVPLAVLEIGVFHSVEPRTETDGKRRYWLSYEAPPFWRVFQDDDNVFRRRPQDAVHCFTSLFAPTGMNTKLFHVWEWWDAPNRTWIAYDRIDVVTGGEVVGGRESGYRTWSKKRNVRDGDWRVRVVDGEDRELGRTAFTVRSIPDGRLSLIERAWD